MLADEIIVVSSGQVLQSGSCREVYQRPASPEIGRLLGIENLFEGVAGAEGVLLAATDRTVSAPGDVTLGLATGLPTGARLLWQVPAEALRVRPGPAASAANGSAVNFGRGRVTDVVDLGRAVEVVVVLSSGLELRARSLDMPDLSVGADCRVETDKEAMSVWAAPDIPAPGGVRDDPAPLR